jgi:uncharacterized membrane protein YdbT with pleckstrin-like domain
VSYPEKVLADDERVVAHLHPHWITMAPAVFWFIVICGAAGAGIAFLPSGGAHLPLLIAILAVGFILLCWLTVRDLITWRTSHYVFTTHRVLIRRGVLHHIGRDISLQRINDVAFSQTLWDRIVKAGTLTIESAGENGQETLHNIPHSDEIQQLLNRLIEEDGERRARQAYGGAAQYPPPPPPGYGYPQTSPYPPQQ